ncbi:HEAT repeat protein [Symmachiella dynata]|uniref:HEAT repeat protein n=2 Tax=Symmachiella dynata TaxID=2527995 RepID=A0A517ZMZ6_9PLAN|nr:HEAT repeat protein [Symmachiella dynata]
MHHFSRLILAVLLVTANSHFLTAAEPSTGEIYDPPVAKASNAGAAAIEGMEIPAGFRVELFAAEPLLANPVAFCIDEQGRFYVAETFRHHAGVTDTRGHMYWLDDDLACRTVADRVAMYKKHFSPEVFDSYGLEHDRVRMIVDSDGNGRADKATVFADGFNDRAVGIGAGVLARDGKLWYACLPDLWQLEDTDGDGRADVRESLHTGYGIHVGFLGHDLHGLRFGPDGRLYFSIGDRGINIQTEGRHLFYPDTGTVLRCEPDGSNLEVFASGLRNPQELAFDDYGNLFTVDNNSDSGDKARLVYIVEGGDSGWRIGFQFITSPTSRGPWNAEKLWHPKFDGQAAYHLPPLVNLADGPSGLTYYPGTGLPQRYNGHFFLSDFRGSTAISGVRSFAVEQDGASYKIADEHKFLWQLLTSDVEFGDDGNLYLLNWVNGWEKTGKGRIYKVFDPKTRDEPIVAEVLALTRAGMSSRSDEELQTLLGHPNQRIRQAAQFELAARPAAEAVPVFTTVAQNPANRLARLHAIWGLGQILRVQHLQPAFATLVALLSDDDTEVRAQAAKTIGDVKDNTTARSALIHLLSDNAPRPRFFAALALGKMPSESKTIQPLLEMLRANNNQDRYLRHAGVVGLAGLEEADLLKHADDNSAAVRMGILLALRRLESPAIARFLNDADPLLVVEAARAINDVPINSALPELAAVAGSQRPEFQSDEALQKRIINANFRLGELSNAKALSGIALNESLPDVIRTEALLALADWQSPNGKDRVTGLWRPLPPRPVQDLAATIDTDLSALLQSSASPDVKVAAVNVLGKFGSPTWGPQLLAIVSDSAQPAQLRAECLTALAAIDAQELPGAVDLAIEDKDANVRNTGRELLAKTDPDRAVPLLAETVKNGSLREQQSALATLGHIKSAAADDLLLNLLAEVAAESIAENIRLDVRQAAAQRQRADVVAAVQKHNVALGKEDPVSFHRDALTGGDAGRGKKIFFERTAVSCMRCHKIGGKGGDVGPDLSALGQQQKRQYILEALVNPNAAIAKGYETSILVLESGKTLAGIVKEEDAKQLKLMTSDGKTITVPIAHIEERVKGKSAMPEDLTKQLTPFDLRDLVEFLATQKDK